ncbi:MAG: hypothetical protein K2F77_01095 [Muribaculaceae bacterium]|nr:hypothetical protein [Muribaculaceae bacterium]
MSKQSNISRLCEALAPVGLLMVAVAALVPVFSGSFYSLEWGKWIYAAGALWLLLARLFSPYRGSDMRMRRLVRMQAWSALFFVAGAVFLFMPGTAPRDWLALTMAGAAVQIIASIMIGKRATQSTEDK